MGSDTNPPDDIDIDQVAEKVADRLEDRYSSKISRRAVIGGLIGGGGLGAMSSSASAQTTVGGGRAADAMSDHAAPHYRAPTSEIDETVVDRFVTVTQDDAGLGYDAGDLLRTTGSGVELVSRGYEALETDKLNHVRLPDPKDNAPGIQAAIDDLPPSGGAVFLKEGRYDVESDTFSEIAVHLNKDNVSLIGQGKESVIYLPDNTTETDKGKRIIEIGDHFNDVFQDNCVVKNLTVDGNYQNQGNIGGANDGHNIEVVGSNNLIFDVWSKNATGDGVELTSKVSPSETRDNRVIGNYLQDCYEHNIHLHGCHDSIIANNIADGEYNNGMLDCWSDMADTKGNLIISNTFRDGQQEGIKLYNPNSGVVATNNWFISNKIVNCTKAGVIVKSGTTNSLVAYNDIKDNGDTGLEINGGDQIRAIGNWIRGGDKHGVRITTGSGALSNLFMRRNLIYNNNQNDSNNRGVWVFINGNSYTNIFVEDNDIISDEAPLHYRPIESFVNNSATITDFYVRDNFLKGKQGGDFVEDSGSFSLISANTPTQPVDVRNYGSQEGDESYHDGTNGNTIGPAFYDGAEWTSIVDGTTIS